MINPVVLLNTADWLKPAATHNALSGLVSRPKAVICSRWDLSHRQITTDKVLFNGKKIESQDFELEPKSEND